MKISFPTDTRITSTNDDKHPIPVKTKIRGNSVYTEGKNHFKKYTIPCQHKKSTINEKHPNVKNNPSHNYYKSKVN